MSTTELPPAHLDTPQQQLSLRRNKAAQWVRKTFPRGTRVEATAAFDQPGNGNFGTVVNHIAGHTALGGHLTVLWDRHPVTGQPHLGKGLASSLLVVDPQTGRGIVRPGIGNR